MKTNNDLRKICLNEDNGHFYSTRKPEEINEKEIRNLVDTYVNNTQVGQILFCVNVRKALFNSKTWEPIFKGYDPERDGNQEMFQWLPKDQRRLDAPNEGLRQVHNIWLMTQKCLDHFAIWLKRCREKKVEGWLSVRMNDCHWSMEEKSHWHSSFWKENPEYRIVTYRNPLSLPEYSLDFSHQKVREYYLEFIQELFERYDMDGLELDWMRFGHSLPYGNAKGKRDIITEFIKQVKELSKICSKRTGKPVGLAVRIPPDVQTCLSLGYDVIEWIKQELVEQITISNFLCDHWLDYPVETWKAIIGQHPIILAVCLTAGFTDPVNPRNRFLDNADIYRGSAGAALVKGADRIYLFNSCYYNRDILNPRDKMLSDILTSCGSLATITEKTRRHILTFRQFSAPGEADIRKIPIPLKPRKLDLYSRLNRIIFLRFNIGPAPTPNEQERIILGFQLNNSTPELIKKIKNAHLWLNGNKCASPQIIKPLPPVTEAADFFLAWSPSPQIMCSGENVIEYSAPEIDGQIVWAEIQIAI